ncbi:MAG: IS5 family transposase [Nitrospina sp.]|jgi:transposase, IS5 family|nr:IS5 family transposase [Nitrospina sp.]
MAESGLFDLDNRLESLSQLGDPLENLNQTILCYCFRPTLTKALKKFRKRNAGRKLFDSILMFKIFILQSLYSLSDDQTEYQIKDRLSLTRFLSLQIEDTISDAKTLWAFRDKLSQKAAVEKRFKRFNRFLDTEGFVARQRKIIDASIVPVPIQGNTREENESIKQDEAPAASQSKPHKLPRKHTDARWTKKNGASYFGYKNHVNTDRKYKLIRDYETTHAAVHDSQVFVSLLDPNNTGKQFWADSTYLSKRFDQELKRLNLNNKIYHKGYRDRPLSEAQRRVNKKCSKVRARVEHVFGYQQNSLGGKLVRTVGIVRAKAKIGMMNLAYNMKRYVFLQRLSLSRFVT